MRVLAGRERTGTHLRVSGRRPGTCSLQAVQCSCHDAPWPHDGVACGILLGFPVRQLRLRSAPRAASFPSRLCGGARSLSCLV